MISKFINLKCYFFEAGLTGARLTNLLMIVCVMAASLLAPAVGMAKPKQDQNVPEATAMRLGGNDQRMRFVADISKSVGYSVYILPDPFRVIIDLPEINFQLPPGQGLSGRGMVTGYRFGLFSPGRSRIVIDTRTPVLIEKSFVLPATDQKPARLVVDIVKTDRKTFIKNRKSQLGKPSRAPKLASIPIPKPKPKSKPKPRGYVLPDMGKRTDRIVKKRVKKMIIIDPGHGGIDTGAVSRNGIVEKGIVLSLANILRKVLIATGNYEVAMTRMDDTFVPLRKRVEFAKINAGDLFISIHADTVKYSSVRGATLYTLSEKASDAEADALARQENRSDIIAGVDLAVENDVVTDILIDLVLRETKNHSIYFAQIIVKALGVITRVNKTPHRFAGFAVLKAPDIPSVLIELGFLSNAKDTQLLSSPKWRRQVSHAIAGSVDKYFNVRATKKLR